MSLDFTDWQELSNENLEEMIATGLRDERRLLVAMLVQRSIVFRRGLYAMRGYCSLNEYLIEHFGMSRQQAFMRAAIARVIHEHPLLLDMLEREETCLSHLALIAPAHHRRPIAASVKHQVWLRDGGRCTWLSEDGRRCTARHYLQYDHIKMVCQGGSNEADNLRLRCAAHNRLAYTLHANAREERPTLASQEASPVKMIETRKRGHNKIPTKRLF